MTWKDFACLKWQFAYHLSGSYEHCTVRKAKAKGNVFQLCSHVPTEEWKLVHPYSRCYEHYVVNGKLYKSKRKLLEAIKEIKI